MGKTRPWRPVWIGRRIQRVTGGSGLDFDERETACRYWFYYS